MSPEVCQLINQVQALSAQLTAAQNALITEIDTRADASSAVSSANLTLPRIQKIDNLDTTVSSRLWSGHPAVARPMAGGLPVGAPINPGENITGKITLSASVATASVTSVDLINYTGTGVVELCYWQAIISSTAALQVWFDVIIDGVAVYSASPSWTNYSGQMPLDAAIGAIYDIGTAGIGVALAAVPFLASLRVTMRVSAASGITLYGGIKYRKVS